jgi:hypothetical protein
MMEDALKRAMDANFNHQLAHATLVPNADDGNERVPGLRLIVFGEPGGEVLQWMLRIVTQRGSRTDVQLGEFDQALLPTVKDPCSAERLKILRYWEGFGKVVRALLVVSGRPSEHGFTRKQLHEFVDGRPKNGSWNRADWLLDELPKGQPIGKGGAIVLTEQDIDDAYHATDLNPLAVALLCAIAKRPRRRREVSIWFSPDGYERMVKAASAKGINVQKLITEHLPTQYR